MDKNEKLTLIRTMLDALVSLPDGMGLSPKDALAQYHAVDQLEDENKIDECIQAIAQTLSSVETRLKSFEHTSKMLIAQDNEARDKSEDSASVKNLFL